MTLPKNHTAVFFQRIIKLPILFSIVMLLSVASYAQNTKGDKPVSNKGKVRETRFKTRSKQGDRARTKDIAGRRLRTKNKSSASRAARSYPQPKTARTKARDRGDRAAKPMSPTYGSRPRDVQRPWKGHRVNVRSATGKTRNVFPQFGRYNRNSATRPRDNQRAYSNRGELARLKRMQSDPDPGKRRKVIPRSASRAYISKKSINPYARFARKTKKGDQPRTKDIAGRRLRTKNFESRRPDIVTPTYKPYYGRKRVGDNPYRGAAAGRHVSATRSKPRAWRGDIAGRKIRGRDYQSKVQTGSGIFPARNTKPRFGDKPYRKLRGGYKSASRPPEKRTGKAPVPVRTPGIGADRIGKYQGNMRLFEAKPRMGRQGADYGGNILAKKRKKGGKSRSGKLWNNQGDPIPVRTPGMGANRIGKYQGSLKAQRPLKGGGSRSGRLWNNKETPVAVRVPSAEAGKIGKYQGSLKARRPDKGGGSRSGKLWNNKETPIPVRTPGIGANKIGKYQGNLKARRPEKGGGSRSGKLWNNKETPIPVRTPSSEAAKAGGYPGNIKRFSQSPGFSDQGEEFTGFIKIKRPKKSGDREKPVPAKAPSTATRKAGGYPGNIKRFELSPGFSDQGEEFTGYIRLSRFRKNYVRNRNTSDEALKKARPDKSTFQVGKTYGRVKQYNYVHNRSSADEALKVREPGKAFGRATDYQGNIKMKKFDLFEKNQLHPDAKFVKLNKNNVAEERDLFTNIKLMWARLFKKSENQPDHLREKERKPRYDKGEQGLWYD